MPGASRLAAGCRAQPTSVLRAAVATAGGVVASAVAAREPLLDVSQASLDVPAETPAARAPSLRAGGGGGVAAAPIFPLMVGTAAESTRRRFAGGGSGLGSLLGWESVRRRLVVVRLVLPPADRRLSSRARDVLCMCGRCEGGRVSLGVTCQEERAGPRRG